MKYFFIGYLLILISFPITIGSGTVNLVPDFIGYWFVVKGIKCLREESAVLSKTYLAANIMTVYSAVLWGLNAAGLYAQLPEIAMLAADALDALGLVYLLFRVVSGIKELEMRRQIALGGKTLTVLWGFLIAVQIFLVVLFPILPVGFMIPMLKLYVVGSFVLTFAILVKLYEAWRAWDKAQLSPAEPTPTVPLEKTELTAPDAASTEPQS